MISTTNRDCDLCKRGSRPIRIGGDQFLPENPKNELLVIKKTDFSGSREGFFKQFAASQVLAWNEIGVSGDGEKEHFYIDVSAALSIDSAEFSGSLEKSAKRHISQDLETVITLDDAGSQALTQAARPHFKNLSGVRFLAASELNDSELKNAGSVMVIAGAITSGRSLLSVARKLRSIHPSSTIVYFVGFSKLPGEELQKQLAKDLKQGGHEFVVLRTSFLPRIKEYTKTAWDWERDKLIPYGDDDPLSEVDGPLPALINLRRQAVISNSLDSDSLFLPDPGGNSLRLRRTFAFWSDLGFDAERLKNATQADVYWTVQCVLHDLRLKSESGGLATAYHTTLISPANFDRYNDGVIQASILRAANPVELDYRVDPKYSRQMSDVCMSIIRNWENDQGEAALEFLVAIWAGRMHLLKEHVAELAQCRTEEMSEDLKFLLRLIDE